MKLLFILFPGNGMINNGWCTQQYNSKMSKMVKNNFIKEIKKLGDIYYYKPKYYNIFHYENMSDNSKLFNKDIDFTKDDIDIDKICKKIYTDVKNFDGKLILLGHSMGAYFVYYFAKKYYDKCLFGIIIDGMFINSINYGFDIDKYNNNMKKYTKYTNNDIQILINKVKNNNQSAIKELFKVYFFNIAKYSEQIKKIKKFKIPMLSFYNFEIESNKIIKKINDSNIIDISNIRKYNNDEDYKIIEFVNKTHSPHLVEESKNIILDNIKIFISRFIN